MISLGTNTGNPHLGLIICEFCRVLQSLETATAKLICITAPNIQL